MEAEEKMEFSSRGESPPGATDRRGYWRNVSGFWLLGLCNNFAYVIMLSAAHDILSKQEGSNSTIPSPDPNDTIGAQSHGPVTPIGGESNGTGRYDCNPISTAAILLADILPTLAIKLTAPFFIHLIPYGVRVLFCALTALSSFLVVSFSVGTWMSILGVVFASLSSGLGEYTFLSLTSFFHVDVVSGWSSGTGAAGLLGALSYSGLTQGGLNPRHTLQVMVVIPVVMWASYFYVLMRPLTVSNWRVRHTYDSTERLPIIESENSGLTESNLTVHRKMLIIRGLLKFMIPLGLIYFAEYFINQGLFELLYFRNSPLDHAGQYRWYQTLYQLGVFLSRSSGKCFHLRRIWILAVLQFVNLLFLFFAVWYSFLPSIWIVFAIILYEGLLGGAGYVNTFHNISLESPEEEREFAMGAASVADTLGIALSGAAAVPFHDRLCRLD